MRFTLPLIALAAVATPVLAAPQAGEQTVTLRVAYGDVDVTSEEGRAALEARIDAKLRQACKLEGAARYAYGRTVVDEKCVAEARTAALAEVERVAAAEARRGREVAAN
ncbi:UrcA family protein [Erythrobacter sp. sf7]|uniref:UrcA family protein n=1 Tax=Erythrobacter fulvus TaxID=2987523 RepID=A0ABT5JSP7_9SPHN|nr:UrcA family protein [Erythrobacter fulvus]MDC8755526.1 UrcA family protein [Erythrobacter fulvus]